MKPTAFISYCWDTETEKNRDWVEQLTEKLMLDDIEVILDRRAVNTGGHIPDFITRAINHSDAVLMICTPTYKFKAENNTGVVGFEAGIILTEIMLTADHERYITILKDGDISTAVPIGFKGKNHVFLNQPVQSEGYREQYLRLLDDIRNRHVRFNNTGVGNSLNPKDEIDFNNVSFRILRNVDDEKMPQYIAHYKMEIKRKRFNPVNHFYLGLCYLHLRKHEIALKELKMASDESRANSEYQYYFSLAILRGRDLADCSLAEIAEMKAKINLALNSEIPGLLSKYYGFLYIIERRLYQMLQDGGMPESRRVELTRKIKVSDRDEFEMERLASLLKINDQLEIDALGIRS